MFECWRVFDILYTKVVPPVWGKLPTPGSRSNLPWMETRIETRLIFIAMKNPEKTSSSGKSCIYLPNLSLQSGYGTRSICMWSFPSPGPVAIIPTFVGNWIFGIVIWNYRPLCTSWMCHKVNFLVKFPSPRLIAIIPISVGNWIFSIVEWIYQSLDTIRMWHKANIFA